MHAQTNRLLSAFENLSRQYNPGQLKRFFKSPVFIVSAPRSGSTLLFEALARNPDFWTMGEESHSIYNALPNLDPAVDNYRSGRLSEKHADSRTRQLLKAGFLLFLRDSSGQRFVQLANDARPASVRFLEKTPRNALNIPFLLKAFPDARFIFLHREAKQNISSIIEAWDVGLKDGSFITFPDLPGWDRRHWCMLLPPDWQSMNGRSFAEIAAFQWQRCNEAVLDDLARLPSSRWTSVSYQALTENPVAEVERLCRFSQVCPGAGHLSPDKQQLPLSKTTLTPPDPEKWRRHEQQILPLLPSLAGTISRLEKVGSRSG